jgi:hypothetical protein
VTFCTGSWYKCDFFVTNFSRPSADERSIKLSSHHDFNQIQFNAPLNPVLIGRPDALINYARPQFSRPSIGRRFILYIYAGAHAKLFFFLLFSAGCGPKTMARSPLFIRNFRCVHERGAEIYTSARRTIKFPYARAFQIKRESFFSKLKRERERDDVRAARPSSVCVWICASVEIVRAALLRPWIFDYSFRLTKHREPVFEKQSFCLERRPRARERILSNETNMGRIMEANNEIVFRFVSRESAEIEREMDAINLILPRGNNSPSCYNNCKLNYWLCAPRQ